MAKRILGSFFMFIAVMGAIGMVTELLYWDLLDGSNRQFNASFTYGSSSGQPISTSLAPIYYSTCLVVGSWLLFGWRES
jgi:hypothetical protein|tara:strand:+ start:71 stop:307 length:237 start_codon:yes stop_codon:yes gene_type:complete